jgi:hypothetical protein
MQIITNARTMAGPARTVAAFAGWLRELGGDALVQAADLLGGPEWSGRAAAVATAIAEGDDPSDHMSELRALRRLLWLERADAPGTVEATLLASVHPDDPRADEARICAEAMARGVVALDVLARAGIRMAKEAA